MDRPVCGGCDHQLDCPDGCCGVVVSPFDVWCCYGECRYCSATEWYLADVEVI